MKGRVLILAGILLSAEASTGFAQSCSAGQLDSKYGAAGSNGYAQISPLFSVPPPPPDVGVGGGYEGIVHDASGAVYVAAPATIDGDWNGVGAIAKVAATGNRDLSFGGFGTVVPGGQPASAYAAMTRDGAGNVLFASTGGTNAVIVNRYSASGAADTSYGDGVSGVATIPLIGVAAPMNIRAGSDGSVIIAASYKPGSGPAYPRVPVAVKLTPAGALDPSFGTGGVSYFYTGSFGSTGKATDAAIQSDGKILIAGRVGENATYYKFFVARLLANGALDASFGTSAGMTIVDFGPVFAYGRKMAVQSDGKIVVVGIIADPALPADRQAIGTGVIRLLPNGAPDTTFNGTGSLTIQPGSGVFYAPNLALQDNDKILLGGLQFLDAAQAKYVAMAMRLTSTGQPDMTFGTGGFSTIASPLGGNSGITNLTYVPSKPSGNIVLNIGADNRLTKSAAYLAQLDSGNPARCH